ncbi:type II toxin-antitoxin system RatA family toxin [Beijerinckia indica]|uniref:Cyclase/dehydrase n=1 Tax=Beijerinckia indica subsp. indica (strain ATCC 9039 / DSM 1715 / NCIMB 8712) TaxID=395963 RepID=B2IB61_BEII9|nr:SRPBCC family protein [Beijerinckia indica]ACB95145.1 cyclase/dehydrase [Beijerinckia indica subsp. indica ATCC 9039]
MPAFQTERRVFHSADQMLDLVTDIEKYPEFVPMCVDLKVRRRTEAVGTLIQIAQMSVGYKAIRETFTSRVTTEREASRILVEYIDGPFKHLENRWSFVNEDEGRSCLVRFKIAYEFKSRALGLLVGGMFDMAFHKFSEAFEKRADEIYGRSF